MRIASLGVVLKVRPADQMQLFSALPKQAKRVKSFLRDSIVCQSHDLSLVASHTKVRRS